MNRLAAWRSGNGVGRINEVILRRARLVLGWVTCPGSTPGGGTLFRYVTSHPRTTQPFILSGSINWVVSNFIGCVLVAPSGNAHDVMPVRLSQSQCAVCGSNLTGLTLLYIVLPCVAAVVSRPAWRMLVLLIARYVCNLINEHYYYIKAVFICILL